MGTVKLSRLLMKKKSWIGAFIVLFILGLSTACSKKLMPPEVEPTTPVSEGGFVEEGEEQPSDSFGPRQGFATAPSEEEPAPEEGMLSPQEGFTAEVPEEEPVEEQPGVVQEETLAESEVPGGPPILSESGEPMPGSMPDERGMVGEESRGQTGELDGPLGGRFEAPEERQFGSGFQAQEREEEGTRPGPMESPFARMRPEESPIQEETQEARLFSFRPSRELTDIHFEFDKFDLDRRAKEILQENAEYLKQHPSVKIEIQGHCDERGTNDYNLALGQRRATSTKNYLVSLGVEESRVHIISYGEEKPFCFESNENCWWRNRRAHFMVAK